MDSGASFVVLEKKLIKASVMNKSKTSGLKQTRENTMMIMATGIMVVTSAMILEETWILVAEREMDSLETLVEMEDLEILLVEISEVVILEAMVVILEEMEVVTIEEISTKNQTTPI